MNRHGRDWHARRVGHAITASSYPTVGFLVAGLILRPPAAGFFLVCSGFLMCAAGLAVAVDLAGVAGYLASQPESSWYPRWFRRRRNHNAGMVRFNGFFMAAFGILISVLGLAATITSLATAIR